MVFDGSGRNEDSSDLNVCLKWAADQENHQTYIYLSLQEYKETLRIEAPPFYPELSTEVAILQRLLWIIEDGTCVSPKVLCSDTCFHFLHLLEPKNLTSLITSQHFQFTAPSNFFGLSSNDTPSFHPTGSSLIQVGFCNINMHDTQASYFTFPPNAHTEQLGTIFSPINTSCKFSLFMNNTHSEIVFTTGYKFHQINSDMFVGFPNKTPQQPSSSGQFTSMIK